MWLISACLVGLNTTHTGESKMNPLFEEMLRRGEVIPICPEQLGGLATPRPAAEIIAGNGKDVIERRAEVVDKSGCDVTEAFIRGAQEVLQLAQKTAPQLIILKERSPSCGVEFIHDGTFTNRRIPGMGVTTALLQQCGFTIVSDEQYVKRMTRKERD